MEKAGEAGKGMREKGVKQGASKREGRTREADDSPPLQLPLSKPCSAARGKATQRLSVDTTRRKTGSEPLGGREGRKAFRVWDRAERATCGGWVQLCGVRKEMGGGSFL